MSKKVGYVLVTLLVTLVASLPLVIYQLMDKLITYSGVERLKAVAYGWEYFATYPLLGVGWGVLPSWDLVVCLLAGSGLIGLGVFGWLLITTYRRYRVGMAGLSAHRHSPERFALLVLGHSMLMVLLVSQVSGFVFHSLYFWFILGLFIAVSGIRTNRFQPSTV